MLLFLALALPIDITPILQEHCVECHREGEVAPFPLVTAADTAKRTQQIAKVVASRYMPPWKPVEGYGRFANARRLTVQEIATVERWSKQTAPPQTASQIPAFEPASEKPPPDLTIEMPTAYTLAPDGPDTYRCFVLPNSATEDRYVKAVDFQPSNRKIVHHALLFTTTQKLPADYPCFGTPGFVPTSTLGGWSPGNRTLNMPEGTAMRLPKGARIIVQLHFHPTGKPERERSKINLYFAKAPPTRHIVDVGLVSKNIDIPPGDPAYKVRDHFALPVNVKAIGIIPHAHYICRDVKGWATLPDGRRRWLIWIKDWDFDWQDRYWYAQPIALPEGTRVDMEFTYDNSVKNPRNPNSPPKRVTWGAGSTDEMAGLHIQVIPDREEDLPELGRALWGKIMRMVGGRF